MIADLPSTRFMARALAALGIALWPPAASLDTGQSAGGAGAVPSYLLSEIVGGYRPGDVTFARSANRHAVDVMNRLLTRTDRNELSAGTVRTAEVSLIEYRKLSPTKYRVRVHGLHAGIPLVFNETYDRGWKAYLVPWQAGAARQRP